jgi:hypothetical protein
MQKFVKGVEAPNVERICLRLLYSLAARVTEALKRRARITPPSLQERTRGRQRMVRMKKTKVEES